MSATGASGRSDRRRVVHLDGDAFPPHPAAWRLFDEAGIDFVQVPSTSEAEVISAVQDCHGVLTCGVPLGSRTIAAMNSCEVIGRYGVGLESIDVTSATDAGILVVNTPLYCIEEVSDHALALALPLVRNVKYLDDGLSAGRWSDVRRARQSKRIMECVLGVIGMGNIGRALTRKAQGLGMTVVTLDRVKPELADELGIARMGLDELLQVSDVVSLHVPLSPATHHLIGHRELHLMKSTAILINTSRGAIVDETALVAALREGLIAGAGLDVFSPEPPDANNPLLHMDNVVCTPHTGGHSGEAYEDQHRTAIAQVIDVLQGRWPAHVANGWSDPRAARLRASIQPTDRPR